MMKTFVAGISFSIALHAWGLGPGLIGWGWHLLGLVAFWVAIGAFVQAQAERSAE